MEIVDEKLIFVNSELNVTGDGENFRLDFPTSGGAFSVKYPSQIRLTCLQAVIRRTWYQINETNNMCYFLVRVGGHPTPPATRYRAFPFVLPPGDYYSFQQMASAIKDAWDDQATNLYVPGFTIPGHTPYPALAAASIAPAAGQLGPLTVTYNPVTRRILLQWLQSNTPALGLPGAMRPFTWVSPQARTLDNIAKCVPEGINDQFNVVAGGGPQVWADINNTQGMFGNMWEIVGGRVSRPNNPQRLWEHTGTIAAPYPAGAAVEISGFYPAQLNTLEAIYLRTSLIGNNYSTLGFSKDPTGMNDTDLMSSTILAKIPVLSATATQRTPLLLTNPAAPAVPTYKTTDATLIVFNDFVGSQNIQIGGTTLSSVQIALTDSEGRPIQPVDLLQPVAGNLNCKLTLRWEALTNPMVEKLAQEAQNLLPGKPAFNAADGTDQEIGNERVFNQNS